MPKAYLVCCNVAVFYRIYLRESLVLPTYLEKPSAVRKQIILAGHAELTSKCRL